MNGVIDLGLLRLRPSKLIPQQPPPSKLIPKQQPSIAPQQPPPLKLMQQPPPQMPTLCLTQKSAVAEHAYRLALTGILSQHPVLANVGGRLIDLEVKAKIQVARRRAFTHGRGFIKSLYAAVDNVNLSGIHWTTDRSFLIGYFVTLKRHNFKI